MNEKYLVLWTVCLLVFAIWQIPEIQGLDMQKNAASMGVQMANTTFTDVTIPAGLGFSVQRSSWCDYNNDGFEDLLADGCRLYRNNGNGTFSEVASFAVSGSGIWADYDNDGDQDLYIGTRDETIGDKLYRNDGNGTFKDVTTQSFSYINKYATEGAAWGDLDNDGWVDIYVANYKDYADGRPDIIYYNNKNGTFSHVMGFEPSPYCGRGVNMGDYDNDGDLDVYVSFYSRGRNVLFQNNGNRTLKPVDKGCSPHGNYIGSEWGDYDNDGDLDMFVAAVEHGSSEPTILYLNKGQSSGWIFEDVTLQSGIKRDHELAEPAWGDYDADGDLDLYVSCVYHFNYARLYRQDNGKFNDVSNIVGGPYSYVRGTTFVDYNNDGYLDIFIAKYGGAANNTHARLYRNNGNGNHWLKIKLIGTTSNKAAIGARIKVTNGTLTQIREVSGGKGCGSQHSLIQYFGFGQYSGKVSIEIRWPSGLVEKYNNVQTNQKLTFIEGQVPEFTVVIVPTVLIVTVFIMMNVAVVIRRAEEGR